MLLTELLSGQINETVHRDKNVSSSLRRFSSLHYRSSLPGISLVTGSHKLLTTARYYFKTAQTHHDAFYEGV